MHAQHEATSLTNKELRCVSRISFVSPHLPRPSLLFSLLLLFPLASRRRLDRRRAAAAAAASLAARLSFPSVSSSRLLSPPLPKQPCRRHPHSLPLNSHRLSASNSLTVVVRGAVVLNHHRERVESKPSNGADVSINGVSLTRGTMMLQVSIRKREEETEGKGEPGGEGGDGRGGSCVGDGGERKEEERRGGRGRCGEMKEMRETRAKVLCL
ncbi:hypothetical protein Droror1_Dr00000927 [Drosera rotundifolia]